MNTPSKVPALTLDATLLAIRELERGAAERLSTPMAYVGLAPGDKEAAERLRREAETLFSVACFLGASMASQIAEKAANEAPTQAPVHRGALVRLYWLNPRRPATNVVFGKSLFNPNWSAEEWRKESVMRAHQEDRSLPDFPGAVSHFHVTLL